MANYITPAVTPFDEKGNVDYQAMKKLYDYIIERGVDGILVLGSIGEFFGIDLQTKKELIKEAVKIVDKRVPLLVGTASTIYSEVLELSQYSLDMGADAVIIVPPYYFTLSPESIEAFYDDIAEKIDGNIFIYNFRIVPDMKYGYR